MSDDESAPIHSQPRGPWKSHNVFQNTLNLPTTNIPSELEILREVEEIVFKEKVFQNRDGKTLFSIHQGPSGSTLNLYLRDGYQKDIVWLNLIPDKGGHDPYLQIVALPSHPLGNVKIDPISGNLNVCILTTKEPLTYIVRVPMFLPTQKGSAIQILSMDGSHQVAKIIHENEGKPGQVLFQFSRDMESWAKTIILGAFLYLNFHLHQCLRLGNPSNIRDVWIIGCMDWEKRTGSSSGLGEKQRGEEDDLSSKGENCCHKCRDGCRHCLCCFRDCLLCCAQFWECCCFFFVCLPCVL